MVLQLWKSVNPVLYPSLDCKIFDYVKRGGQEVMSSRWEDKKKYQQQFMGMAVYDYFSSLLLTDAELKSGWQHVFVVNPNFSEDEMYHIYVADSENRGMFELQKKHGNVTAFVQQVYVTHFRAGIFSPR